MKPKKTNPREDYEVGYGRPPHQHQFKPGQSGNPRGKEPGTRSLKTELLKELHSLIQVEDRGRHLKITKQTLIVKRMVSDAAKGDAKAREQLLRLLTTIEKVEPMAPQIDEVASAKDYEILERFKRELINNLKDHDHEQR